MATPPPPFRPTVEPLESRELLANAFVQSGALIVEGTSGNDYLSVTQSSGRLSVYGSQINVAGAKTGSVDASTISRVYMYGYAGNDTIIASTVTKDVVVVAGDGNDSVYGGSGNDWLDGGAGTDMIFGGAGNDRIIAGVSPTEKDTLLGGTGFDWFWRPYSQSGAIIDGTGFADVRQGEAPLCQTAASLAELAKQGRNFSNDLRWLGGSSYEIKLYGGLPTQRVTYDGWTNDHDLVPAANGEFWATLFQRARLQAMGIDPTREYTKTEWDAWNVKTGSRLYSIGEALYQFTGSYAVFRDLTTTSALTMQALLARGDYIVAQSVAGSSTTSAGIVRNHAYAVLSVYLEAGVWKVRLFNPWAMDRENGTTMDSLDKSAPAANDGVITLTWQQFADTANFKGYHVAAKK